MEICQPFCRPYSDFQSGGPLHNSLLCTCNTPILRLYTLGNPSAAFIISTFQTETKKIKKIIITINQQGETKKTIPHKKHTMVFFLGKIGNETAYHVSGTPRCYSEQTHIQAISLLQHSSTQPMKQDVCDALD